MANGQTKIRCRFCTNRFTRQGMHKHEEFCPNRPQHGSATVRTAPVMHKTHKTPESLRARLIRIKNSVDVLLKEGLV
jgi:hypothetical protein